MSHISIIYSSVNVLFHVENSLLEVESILKLGSGKKHLVRIFGCDQPYFIKWNISNRQIGLEWTLWNNPKNCFNSTKNPVQTVQSPRDGPGSADGTRAKFGEIKVLTFLTVITANYLFLSQIQVGYEIIILECRMLVMKILSIWLNMPVMIGQG